MAADVEEVRDGEKTLGYVFRCLTNQKWHFSTVASLRTYDTKCRRTKQDAIDALRDAIDAMRSGKGMWAGAGLRSDCLAPWPAR